MAKKLTVRTEFGTFTRTTARTYTHLVIVKGYRAERLEAYRLAEIKETTDLLVRYRRVVERGGDAADRTDRDRESTATFLADGRYAQWIAEYQAKLDRLMAMAPITEDLDGWGLSDENLASTPTWAALGWCGRLDLARKLADTKEAARFREVHIIDLTTGQAVR